MIFLIYFWCAFLKIYDNVSVISNATVFSTDNRNYKSLNELALDLERSEENRVKESPKCSNDDIRDSIQCFLIVPNSTYVVEVNGSVEMPCVVLNQHGKVQWRANSDLLGYDRFIPGRPRFRIVGDPSKGEHILKITNISTEDTGKYECQVQPIGIKHSALRRITYVEVIVLPDSPRILHYGKVLADEIFEISAKRQFNYIELKCISKRGLPLVTFNWFVNGRSACKTISNCNIQRLSSSTSKIRFMPHDLKTIHNISCSVVNAATRRYPLYRNENTVRVVIQTPPNTPEIQSFTNENIIKISENDSVKLFCHCTPPGVPAASLYWEWRWPHPTLNESRLSIDRNAFTVSHSKISTISSLHLSHVSRQYHAGTIHCIADHPTGNIASKGVQIMIKYPPKYINITTPNDQKSIFHQDKVILLNENSEQKLNCDTSEYYGDLNLQWKIDTEDKTMDTNLRSVEKVWQIESSYKRQSTISISLESTKDEMKLNCVLFFMDKIILKTSISLMKIKMPKSIEIKNYQSTYVIEENKILRLQCISEGGRPVPQLEWILNGDSIINSKSQDFSSFNSAILQLKIKRSHNGASLRCQTQMTFSKSKPMSSRIIKLTVVFPPLHIKIENSHPKPLSENEIVFFNCLTTESNPPSGLVWKIKICKSSETEICKENNLAEMKEYISSGSEYRGYVTKSILKMKMSWKHHLAFLICETIFSYTQIAYPILRSQIQLSVAFKPNFVNMKNQSQIFFKTGLRNQSISILSIANPTPIQFQWLYKNQSPLISFNEATIYFQRIDEEIIQDYQLVASNKLGDSLLVFKVEVTYSPRIIGETNEKYQVQSKITELECIVESNPSPQLSFINWIFLGLQSEFNDVFHARTQTNYTCNQGHWEMKKLKLFIKCRLISPKRLSSSLVIYDTTPEDVGTYICRASDFINPPKNKTIELITLSIPHFISIPLFSKVAIFSQSRSKARTLIYSGVGPNVTLYIESVFNKTFFYPSIIQRMATGLYLVTSEFNYSLDEKIEKLYFQAENQYGNAQLLIEPVPEGVPDAPLLQDIKYTKPNTISVKITQTFDGGYPQIFEVYYKEASGKTSDNKMIEVQCNYFRKNLFITIPNVKNKNYEIQICSRNPIHGRSRTCPSKFLYSDGRQSMDSGHDESNENLYELLFQFNLKIIIAVAGFVFGLILLAISLIIFLFKRKRNLSTIDLRSNIDLNYKFGNDLLIPNLTLDESKSEFFSISSADKSVIPLYQSETQCSQSKV